MQNISIVSLLLLCFNAFSLRAQNQTPSDHIVESEPIIEPDSLIADYMTWWTYHYNQVSLSSDFLPLNENSEIIQKEDFLKALITGQYIAVEVESDAKQKGFKLFELPDSLSNGISSTIKNVSKQAFTFYRLEGSKFPIFHASDLDGIEYTDASLMGKTTIIKTWFTACQACIKEMPELNEFVESMAENRSFQFLSLALDSKDQLIRFLEKREFKYIVLSEQESLIQEELGLNAYPSHLVVDKNGKIEKVFQKSSELIDYIRNRHDSK